MGHETDSFLSSPKRAKPGAGGLLEAASRYGRTAALGATPKSGYSFVNGAGPAGVQVLAADICASAVATSTQFFLTAAPATLGTTGTRFFATDHSGQIRQDNAAIATIAGGVPLQ